MRVPPASARPGRPHSARARTRWATFLVGVIGVGVVLLAGCDRIDPRGGDRSPYGELNLAWSSEPGTIGVVGWAKDPDVDRPIDIVVGFDGEVHRRTAGLYNPYLGGRHAQKFRAFLALMPARAGRHTVCAVAINVGRGAPFRLLGCSEVVVEPAEPIGVAEGFSLGEDGSSVRATGWALDKDTLASIDVALTVDGAVAARGTANVRRDDVAAAIPGRGPHHGYALESPVGPGRHHACATAINVGRGADVTLGCAYVDVPDVLPRGVVESVAVVGDRIVASGWADDPDAPGATGVAMSVRRLSDIDDAATTWGTAHEHRSDVDAVTGLGPYAGFTVSAAVTVGGPHEVCLTAVNGGRGRDASMGCHTVDVADHRPSLTVDEVVAVPGGVEVRGTAADADHAGPVDVMVKIGGSTYVTSASATGSRGFAVAASGLSPGRHSVCVTALDDGATPPGITGNRSHPCGAVVVGPTAVGTTGVAGPSQPVVPLGTLAGIDRDGGVSVRLSDGSNLWLFGDSSAIGPDGSMRYFVAGTAAWAPAHAPGVTTDAEDGAGVPYLLAAPVPGTPACGGSRPRQVLWPVSAVATSTGTHDRVVVYLSNMCAGSGEANFEFKGMAVAHWYYDHAAPPVRQPIRLEILNADLGTPLARPYGSAATIGDDGMIYAYTCGRPANLLDVANFGPCRVARVAPLLSADLAHYTYWNGSGWVSNPNAAAAMSMPDGAAPGYDFPASAFTVVRDDVLDVFVMAYSPWPGFVDQVAVRVATGPAGPWTAPVSVAFEGCDNRVGGQLKSCYAATAQPAFSSPGRLGLGFYDQATVEDRRRGQYRVTSVPFVVTR